MIFFEKLHEYFWLALAFFVGLNVVVNKVFDVIFKVVFSDSDDLKESKKPLSYTDYKEENVLWLQKKYHERTSEGMSMDCFCINAYSNYLELFGIKDPAIYSKLGEYYTKMQDCNLESLLGNSSNMKCDKYVLENINELMDSIFNK